MHITEQQLSHICEATRLLMTTDSYSIGTMQKHLNDITALPAKLAQSPTIAALKTMLAEAIEQRKSQIQ